MGNIVLLDDLTINKIAAGEVIERPASVVKEVVENSIDAGADNISIEIKNGGISYIRITDNGKGIAEDDLEIAFERHATSKIRKAEDLETVKSMGFRGEALASIAAIARVELVTKTEDSSVGHRIVVEGGKIILKEETGCPKGTTITIENLFYNTPVRYKFLKKDFTESGYIEDAITRIALVNPNIAIKFVNTGKTVIQTSGNGNIKDIVYGVYGKDIAENIINVEYYFEDMAVKGVIGNPSIARSNRSNQLFFVNKRFVKDKTLTSSAEQAFKGMLPIGKYGFLILNIEMDPHKLDVNVHPAKLEVRFQEENKIFKLVYHAIKESLLKIETQNKQNEITEDKTMKNDYIDEIQKIENKVFNGIDSNYTELDVKEENKSENKGENKGIGSFFKNILGGSKNEFSTNEGNLVEELYKDKIQHEHEDLINALKDENSASETIDKSEIKNDDVKPESNLERLVKELDANLEKLNMKPQSSILNDLKDGYITEKTENHIDSGETSNFEDSTLNSVSSEISVKETDYSDLNDEGKFSNNYENTINQSIENGQEKYENDYKENENKTIQYNEEQISELNTYKTENNNVNEKESSYEANLNNDKKDIIDINSDNEKTAEKTEEKTKETEQESDANFEEMYAKMFGKVISHKEKIEEKEDNGYSVKQEDFRTVENMSLFTNNAFYNRPVYKYIGIVFRTYIVIEYEKEMYIVDQKSAHERILYEKVKRNYYSDTEKDAQLMLLPDIINLTERQMGIAKDNLELFRKAGFDLEEFGDKTIKLNGVPNICIDLDTRQLFLEILDEINTVARTARQEIEEKFIATIACKSAEKFSLALTEKEVDNLMIQLLSLPQPFVSPNGEPTAIRISKADIEKKFSRR